MTAPDTNVFNAHLQHITLGIASERLTLRLRWDTFKALLRQDVAWFDEPENSTGILTTCLAVDTTHVKGVYPFSCLHLSCSYRFCFRPLVLVLVL